MNTFDDFLRELTNIFATYTVFTYLFIALSLFIGWVMFHYLIRMFSKEVFPRIINVVIAIIPILITCFSFNHDKYTNAIVILTIIHVICAILINMRFYTEQIKKGRIISIQNATSRNRSEKNIDIVVAHVKHNIKYKHNFLDNNIYNKLKEESFYHKMDDVSTRLIDYLGDAYNKSEDKIGINVWLNKKISIDSKTKTDGYWSIIFRRNTNDDPSINYITNNDNTTFSKVKNHSGQVYFENKRTAYWNNSYVVGDCEIKASKRNTSENKTLFNRLRTYIALRGSIYCQNISITLNNSEKIDIVFSVTSYKESLCGFNEKDEIKNVLECFGIEIKSIIAEQLFSNNT